MKRKIKGIKANLITIFFAVTSFMAVTLAWFAYSGLSSLTTDIDVKAWLIELSKDGDKVSNEIVISLTEIYPGMDIISEVMDIKNLGDSDAKLQYNVTSARILGDESDYYEYDFNNPNGEYIEDSLSHNYPFHINMSFSKTHLLAKGDEGTFTVSVSWPLDSDNDAADSEWGNNAYSFQQNEIRKKMEDSSYGIQPSIKIVINVVAEQYVINNESSDLNYYVGKRINFDPVSNKSCEVVGGNCYETRVIDMDNKTSDLEVNLMLSPQNEYMQSDFDNYETNLDLLTSSWQVPYRGLELKDILKIISKDVINSKVLINNLSPTILGYACYENRLDNIISEAKVKEAAFSFSNNKAYLTSDSCYWLNTDLDLTSTYSIIKEDNNTSIINKKDNLNLCNIVPVIKVEKINLT